jgi:hypothetical protein
MQLVERINAVGGSNRNAVASSSPGLPSAATLGNVGSESPQPQRGCVLQPRVAVRGYPGKRAGASPQPQRGCVLQPGAPYCATLEEMNGLTRIRIQSRRRAATALRLLGHKHFPRVAADGNPGLDDTTALRLQQPRCGYNNRVAVTTTALRLHNPVAVARTHARFPG